MTQPLTDVRQISALTYGFIASKALFAALDLDLFTHIARGAATIDELARATGTAANRMRTLVTALRTVGLVTEADGRLANAPATTNFLVEGAPGDFRDYIRVVNGGFLYESMRHLDKAMRGERVFPDKGFYTGIVYSEGGVGGEAFSSAQHAGSLGPAALMARRVDLAGAARLLDVGGGSGAYTLAFLRRNPALRATILDFPETVETARRMAQQAGLADRITHLAGNALSTQWPQEQDVMLMSYVWSAVGAGDIRELARRARAALKPGGLVLIHDFMVDDTHDGPDFAAWYLLASIFDNPDAECLTPGFVEGVLREAGFGVEGTKAMLEGITSLTRARAG
ncbi:MAG: methyltransferase [Alphaproteobacteria bacterium]|nr:methyltransferase [Alphaproteobacteria bacterium]MCW5743675.1 methyltransferase [Alphaproteobacteria bacterium]